ncbi:response regulator [Pseudobacteriovorax antillogorgiicola]|uniref:Response regulator receiver domain-containing protein n=1 Tax=Pseudobacteriovorax antillogorgiicola TaxID=1513793 RepID=A0A1Y6BRE2_9BACT|nr:response regulator [Pseudobacteriovorax antillogorgiicola]TCS54643.1 response regulator receiver protein [Pseudobacteriovorax antillogorgiicola]SMF17008.1 Response regulator receiver domain-containing protein [Pseudobacteriovorax antillogorgiicola]
MAKPKTILVVDDDKVDREFVLRSLRKRNVLTPTVEASDGLEALEILRAKHHSKSVGMPVLVLLDIRMPKMSGLEFLQEVRADRKLENTIIFILTTSEREEEITQAYDLKVNGYITKDNAGSMFDDLVTLIDSYLKIVEFPLLKR